MYTERSPIRGLYAITPDIPDTHQLQHRVQQAIDGDVKLLQYRAKSLVPAMRLQQARALAAQCAAQGVHFIVNDDRGLAQTCQATGVHLGLHDEETEDKEFGNSKHSLLVGISCYDSLQRAQAAELRGADYVAFGSMFPSPTKPAATRAPLSLLHDAKQQLRIPVVAIGGITLPHMDALVKTGIDAVAVLSALFDAPDITAAARHFNAYFGESHVQS